MNDNLLEALRLTDLGVSVIPIRPASKVPALRSWSRFQQARADHETLERWFERPETGLAVICGNVSDGLVVRDFDQQDAYDRWAREFRGLADSLPTVRTARGCHVYARVRGSSRTRRFPDGELRGEGAYVVGPPSRHSTGTVYRWRGSPPSSIPFIDTPDRLLLPVLPHSPHHDPWPVSHQQALILGELVTRHLPTGTGQREARLFDLARELKAQQPDCSEEQLRQTFALWWPLAWGIVATKDETTSWTAFQRAWANCRFPHGARWQQAVRLAEGRPAPRLPAALAGVERLKALAGLCAALQEVNDGPFALGCRRAAEFLGTSKNTAARDIEVLVAAGVLVCTKTEFIKAQQAREYVMKLAIQQEIDHAL
ncbi:MAG TPA: hypothetical protein DDY91_02620 [Planctomycetaceae bacterium]|nr:hypothetical protein [Planctomycetaceae bacterium]